jgi:hypothetical protein
MRCDARSGVVLLLLLSFAAPCAAQTGWQPAQGHPQVPIWPGDVPDAQPAKGPEVSGIVVDEVGRPKLVGGKPSIYVNRVSQPTMTVPATTIMGQRRSTGQSDAAPEFGTVS